MKLHRRMTRRLPALVLALSAAGVLMTAQAAESKDEDRIRFYGWVEVMPEGLHGTWVIGGHPVTTDPRTEFDETDGPLMIGGCAKVDIRAGFVHEIESEPPSDCR